VAQTIISAGTSIASGLIGAEVGTAILPGPGTLIGGFLGATVGGFVGAKCSKDIKRDPLSFKVKIYQDKGPSIKLTNLVDKA